LHAQSFAKRTSAPERLAESFAAVPTAVHAWLWHKLDAMPGFPRIRSISPLRRPGATTRAPSSDGVPPIAAATGSDAGAYIAGAAFVALAAWGRLVLESHTGAPFPFVSAFLAILATAWIGGFGPTFVATLLAAAIAAWSQFLPSPFMPTDAFRGVLGIPSFILAGLSLAAFSGSVRKSLRDARAAAADARARSAELQREIRDHLATQAELRELNERQRMFIATLGHELRNPLAPIRTSLEIVRRSGQATGAAEKSLEVLERQVAILSRLVEDLLDLGRIESGKVALRRADIDLRTVVTAAAESAHADAGLRGRMLEVNLPPDPLYVAGDATRLQQVLGNLLGNAVKFTHPGGRIELTALAEGEEAVVQLRDDGAGIAPALVARIFEPFVQAEYGLEGTRDGLGIGLSLVKGIVELHGGRVEASSEGEGKGAAFVVRLPRVRRPALPVAKSDAPAAKRVPASAAGLRALVVDDNVDAADSLAALLQTEGFATRVLYGGGRVLDSLCEFAPHAVFLDIGMPGLDGYAVARAIRADPRGRAVRLYAVSGWGQAEHIARAREAGFDLHLAKPLDLAALDRALAPVLAAREAAATSPR
jgi:signal transduction histidine kinase/ActR/RegA family two-component response regulator